MKTSLRYLTTFAALSLAFAITNAAKATPITGSISFTGTPAFINGDTAVKFSSAYVNQTPTGSFAPLGDLAGYNAPPVNSPDIVSFQTIIFDPLTLPTGALWKVVVPGGDTYSLVAKTINFSSPPSQAEWDFSGTGWLSITGPDTNFSTTLGTWGITFSQNGQLSFEATSGAGVPDGGSTALLVGACLLALAVFVRRGRLLAA